MAEVAFALFAVLLGCLLVWRFSTFEILEISSVFAVGTLFGIGFCSCLFFLCRLLFPGIAHLSLWLESLLFLLVTADLIRTRRRLNFHWPRLSGLELSLGALLVLAIAIGTFAMFSAYRLNPQGQWDAWSIWNLRAKFLTADGRSEERRVGKECA